MERHSRRPLGIRVLFPHKGPPFWTAQPPRIFFVPEPDYLMQHANRKLYKGGDAVDVLVALVAKLPPLERPYRFACL